MFNMLACWTLVSFLFSAISIPCFNFFRIIFTLVCLLWIPDMIIRGAGGA